MRPALPRPNPTAPTARLALAGLAAGLLLAAAAPALAQYKWKDGRGQIHISDLPPPREVPDKDVLQRPAVRPGASPAAAAATPPAPAASAASAPRAAPVDPELEARRRRAEQEAQAKARADEAAASAQRADNCQRARQQLATLDSGRRLVRSNARGEPEVLDDAARAAEAQRARQVIASDCR